MLKTVPLLTEKEVAEFLRRLRGAGDGVLRDLGIRLLADMEWFRDMQEAALNASRYPDKEGQQ